MLRQSFQLLGLALLILVPASGAGADESGGEIFARRILPLAKADRPSSCTECHAAGVDLSQYIRDDEAQTFAALQAAGLVNAQQPKKSKLLEFIARAPEKGNPLLAKIRAEELAAFSTWIEAAAKEYGGQKLVSANAATERIGPALPVEVIRHARKDRILQSFVENVWIERERCAGCHSPDKNARVVKEHGEQVSWISPGDPAGTLSLIIEHGLINTSEPAKSKLLQKPLNEIEHGGHVKFTYGTRTDKQFRLFLDDYAATVTGKYHAAADLPAVANAVNVATAQHLRMTDLPADLGGKLIRIDLHGWADGSWSPAAVGSVDGRVNPKNGMFQGVVFATIPRTLAIAKEVETRRQFPTGRYLVKVYVDRLERSAENRDYELSADDFIGQLEFDGDWPAGYSPPKILSAGSLSAAQ